MIEAKAHRPAVAPGVSVRRLNEIESELWADHDRAARAVAEREAAGVVADNRARPVLSWMPDRALRELARGRADLMNERVQALGSLPRAELFPRLSLLLGALDVRPIADTGQDLGGALRRVVCRDWWARRLKRRVVELREQEARESGEVCAVRRQPYVSDDTVRRMIQRDQRGRAMLETTEIESAAGQVITLAQAADAGVSNPEIRRGELMTRIRGCEEWADGHQWPGLFTTNTAPSRFHAVRHDGKRNPAWVAAGRPTVKDGQRWLCTTWAACRADMQRQGLEVFGFRVAEPHQDATPHWHMLIWCKPGQREAVQATMRKHWLKDTPDESGAHEHRFKAKPLTAGGAAGYIAKYIAKGIDDQGAVSADGHIDDTPEGRALVMDQRDMFGGGATRVRAWARAHGIRQFQPIGQAPVTVWRELRRVSADSVASASLRLTQMWDAVNRHGERRASFGTFLELQGGACIGRDYAVSVARERETVEGRYETAPQDLPVGVTDRMDEHTRGRVIRSDRQRWKPRGTWAAMSGGVVIVGLCDVTRAHEWRRAVSAVQAVEGGKGYEVAGGGKGACRVGGAGRAGVADRMAARVSQQGPQARAAWTRENNCTGQGPESAPLGALPGAQPQWMPQARSLERIKAARQWLQKT